jgi:hypothetical protein
LLLRLLLEDRFPRIWVPDAENRDLRQLLTCRLFDNLQILKKRA